MVTQLIQEAFENKGDLVVLWLDLTNAYGSIPQAGGGGSEPAPYPWQVQRPLVHTELLQRLQFEGLVWDYNISGSSLRRGSSLDVQFQ